MQSKRNHTLIQIALVLVVIIIGWYVLGGSDKPEPATQQKPLVDTPTDSNDAAAPVSGIDQLETDTEAVEDMTPRRTAKRINPATVSPALVTSKVTQSQRPATNWQNEYEAADALEAALMGDTNEAISIGDLVLQCRAGFDNEQVVQSNLDRMTKNAKQGRPLPGLFMPSTGNTREFANIGEYESYLWNTFAKCQTSRAIFDKEQRKRLQEKAEAGNVQARYMYAMWVPTQSGMSNDDMLDWMIYQSHAMDYTWQNILEGQPLGLLAYGRSLEQSGHVYFTPRHTRYGPAFIMAAYKCGLENDNVGQKVGNLTSQWQRRNQVQASNSATSLSDMLVNTYCH